MLGKGASLPGSYERYLQPPVKLPSGDDTHAGRHAGVVIRLGYALWGQLYSAAMQLSEPPTAKTVQVTMEKERKQPWIKRLKTLRQPRIWKLQLLCVKDVQVKQEEICFSSFFRCPCLKQILIKSLLAFRVSFFFPCQKNAPKIKKIMMTW